LSISSVVVEYLIMMLLLTVVAPSWPIARRGWVRIPR
jgi:hypothetical protein